MNKINAFTWPPFIQSLFDIVIKVGAYALVMLLNFVIAGLSNGSIQLPGGAVGVMIASTLALILSQLDSKFVNWSVAHNLPVPTPTAQQ
jgi:hypothetical protein